MARRDWDDDRQRAYRSGWDEGSDFEPRLKSRFDRDPNFERSLRAPFREFGRAGGRELRRDQELERGSRMHFEEERGGYGESPLYESGRYGGSGPRSDYEFGGGGFQRFGDPYGFESGFSRTPEGSYSGASFGRAAGYGRSNWEWNEGRREQSKRGLGPKNYARSDARIHEDICDELTEDPVLDASDIEVKVANGEVTLAGTVETREAKRRAEDDADQIIGVRHVQNNLRVEQPLELRQRETGTVSGTAGGNVTGTVAARTEPAREREKA